MMKKRYFAAAAVCVMAMSMFTGCAGNDGKDIGKDAAKTAAFSDAGVTEDEITRLKVSKRLKNLTLKCLSFTEALLLSRS